VVLLHDAWRAQQHARCATQLLVAAGAAGQHQTCQRAVARQPLLLLLLMVRG
jgi:hypothetical protein